KGALKDLAAAIAAGNQAARDDAQKRFDAASAKMNLHDLEEVIKDGNEELVEALGDALNPELFAKAIDSDNISSGKKHAMQERRFGSYHGINATAVAK